MNNVLIVNMNNGTAIRILNNNKVAVGGTRIISLKFGGIYAEKSAGNGSKLLTNGSNFQKTSKAKFRRSFQADRKTLRGRYSSRNDLEQR